MLKHKSNKTPFPFANIHETLRKNNPSVHEYQIYEKTLTIKYIFNERRLLFEEHSIEKLNVSKLIAKSLNLLLL